MSCEIIQLSMVTRRRRQPKPPKTPESGSRAATPGGWPCRMVDYWRARLDWAAALEIAHQYGIADSASFPSQNEDRFGLVDKWREEVSKKLLTPAPDLAAIT